MPDEDGPHKGIMLCERPKYSDGGAESRKPGMEWRPVGVMGEAPGLSPHKKVLPAVIVKPSITVGYKAYLQQYQTNKRLLSELEQIEAAEAQARAEAVTAFGEKLRATILRKGGEGGGGESQGGGEEDSGAEAAGAGTASPELAAMWKAAATQKLHETKRADRVRTRPLPPPPASLEAEALLQRDPEGAARLMRDVDDFVEEVCKEAMTQGLKDRGSGEGEAGGSGAAGKDVVSLSYGDQRVSPAAAAPTPAPGKKPSAVGSKGQQQRPAWALSEEQAEAIEDQEAEDLLGFASGLDFDAYVDRLDDVNLRDTFKALQEAETQQEGGGDEKTWRQSFVTALNQAAFLSLQQQQQQQQQKKKRDGGDGAESVAESALSRGTHTSRMRSDATAAKLAAAEGRSLADGGVAEAAWDSRTTASTKADDVASSSSAAAAAARGVRAAEEFLLEHPELKAVHSVRSVQAIQTRLFKTILEEEGEGGAIQGATATASPAGRKG